MGLYTGMSMSYVLPLFEVLTRFGSILCGGGESVLLERRCVLGRNNWVHCLVNQWNNPGKKKERIIPLKGDGEVGHRPLSDGESVGSSHLVGNQIHEMGAVGRLEGNLQKAN